MARHQAATAACQNLQLTGIRRLKKTVVTAMGTWALMSMGLHSQPVQVTRAVPMSFQLVR